MVSIGAKGLSRSRDQARFTQADSVTGITRGRVTQNRGCLSLSIYLSTSLPLAQPCEMNIFRKQRPPAFFSPSMPGITMSPVLSFFPVSLFLLFFEKHIYNGRCATVFYFFYFFSPESQYNTGVISVKIFATIFTSFHPTDTVSRKDR